MPIDRRAVLSATGLVLGTAAAGPAPRFEQSGFVSIGGIEQWIAIAGPRRAPAILYLHGGPAEAQSPFLAQFAPWERSFIVANWDQRGAGKTFGRNGRTAPDLSLDRLIADTIAVADYVRGITAKRRLILVGQSWGAILGMHVVRQRPEMFSAFVGTGFPVSWPLVVEGQERWARQNATANHDAAALRVLDETAALPLTDVRRMMASFKWRMSASDLDYLKGQRTFLDNPKDSDAADWKAGSAFTIPKLIPVIYGFDARKLGLEWPLSFFVIQGWSDHVAPFEAARDYVAQIRAPAKAFVPIAGGHFACFTNAQAFVASLGRLTG
jgi:pimeloyl-ACP methyl ester carboxylesterase